MGWFQSKGIERRELGEVKAEVILSQSVHIETDRMGRQKCDLHI